MNTRKANEGRREATPQRNNSTGKPVLAKMKATMALNIFKLVTAGTKIATRAVFKLQGDADSRWQRVKLVG